MAENSSTSNSKVLIPWGLICALVFLGTGFTCLWNCRGFWRSLFLHSTPGFDDAIRVEAALHLLPARRSGRRLTFFLGSSQTREGIDVRVLNSGANTDRYVNLGFSGSGQPIILNSILHEVLAYSPNEIVLMLYPGSFYRDLDYSELSTYFSPSILSYFRRFHHMRDVVKNRTSFYHAMVGYLLPPYRLRYALRRYVASVRQPTGDPNGDRHYFLLAGTRSPAYFQSEVAQNFHSRYKPNAFTQMNIALLDKLIETIQSAHVRLILIDAPTYPTIEQTYSLGVEQSYQRILSRAARRYHLELVTRDELPKFEAGDFYDFTHLNAGGRKKLTAFVANLMISARQPAGHIAAKAPAP